MDQGLAPIRQLRWLLRHALSRARAVAAGGVLLCAAAFAVQAQEPQSGASAIGFVDMPRLLEQAPQMREWRQRLQAEFAQRNRELAAEASSIEELKRKRNDSGTPLSATESAELERRISAAERSLKRARTELGNLESVRKNEALDAISKRIGEAAAEAARERGFGAVQTRENAVYIDPALDLTEAVLARLKQSEAPGKPQ